MDTVAYKSGQVAEASQRPCRWGVLIHCPVKIPKGPGLQPSSQPPSGLGVVAPQPICNESIRWPPFFSCTSGVNLPHPRLCPSQAPHSAPGLG